MLLPSRSQAPLGNACPGSSASREFGRCRIKRSRGDAKRSFAEVLSQPELGNEGCPIRQDRHSAASLFWTHLHRPETRMAGGLDQWTVWLEEHSPALVLLARQWVARHADARDVVQEAFVRFWRSRQRVADPAAYLY